MSRVRLRRIRPTDLLGFREPTFGALFQLPVEVALEEGCELLVLPRCGWPGGRDRGEKEQAANCWKASRTRTLFSMTSN